jgi:hypothetical protein
LNGLNAVTAQNQRFFQVLTQEVDFGQQLLSGLIVLLTRVDLGVLGYHSDSLQLAEEFVLKLMQLLGMHFSQGAGPARVAS